MCDRIIKYFLILCYEEKESFKTRSTFDNRIYQL